MTYHTTRRVEFSDTDAAGIAHFSAFFRYMEQVEHEFLRSRGTSVVLPAENVGWPRVSARCDYTGAVKFEDLLDIEMRVARLGEKSITYSFTFAHDGRPVAEGQVTAVFCRLEPGKPPVGIKIPDDLRRKLSA